MRKSIFTVLFLLPLTFLMAQNLNASLNFAKFYNPELGPYVETYLSVDMNGLKLVKNEEGKYYSQVNLLLMFKRNDSIVDFSKTTLTSPAVEDTNNINLNFLDQQRFFLANGKYTLDIEFADANTNMEPNKARGDVELAFGKEKVQMSDVQFIESYEKSTEWKINTKNGYDMVPHVSNYYGDHEEKLTFYTELYHAKEILGEGEKFLMTAYISETNAANISNDLVIRKRMDAETVNVLLNQFDISKLNSGNYNLVIELRNKNNEILEARKTQFQVNNTLQTFDEQLLALVAGENSFVNRFSNDSLTSLINCLYPIASPAERAFIKNSLSTASEDEKRRFLSYFWKSKDAYDPENAWKTYQLEVIKTDRSFGNKYVPGYATDMGKVYLQFGPPNTIADQEYESGGGRHEGAVPYQIWHYYEIGDQRNGKFVFYNPHLIHKGYTLLHSNVVGEISNPHWQSYLHRDQLKNIDAPDDDRYEGQSGELYNNPR